MAGQNKAEMQGLPELQSALKEINKAFPKEVKKAAEQIARDWIAAARNKADAQARQAAQALSIGTDPDGALVTNSDVTFYGNEFGGQARPSTMQFPPHLGQRGYFLFPAARENADKFQKIWEAAIDDATKSWDYKA
jgi:hypothetical protein